MEISAAKFKAQCLKLMDQVRLHRLEIVVTKRGVPVAKMIPVEPAASARLMGHLEGSVTIAGELLETGETWEAEQVE